MEQTPAHAGGFGLGQVPAHISIGPRQIILANIASVTPIWFKPKSHKRGWGIFLAFISAVALVLFFLILSRMPQELTYQQTYGGPSYGEARQSAVLAAQVVGGIAAVCLIGSIVLLSFPVPTTQYRVKITSTSGEVIYGTVPSHAAALAYCDQVLHAIAQVRSGTHLTQVNIDQLHLHRGG